MSRWSFAALVLAACAPSGTPVTHHVATLGYAAPPAVSIVTRGDADIVAPWEASLRATTAADVRAEFAQPEPTDPAQLDTRAICSLAADPHVEEILVVTAVPRIDRDSTCIDKVCEHRELFDKKQGDPCMCVKYKYRGTKVVVESRIDTIRTSSCEVIRTTPLPISTGATTGAAGDEYQGETFLTDGIRADAAEVRRQAIERLTALAPRMPWNLWPRAFPIVHSDGNAAVVQNDAAHTLGGGKPYFLKRPGHAALEPLRGSETAPTQVTLEAQRMSPAPAPGDEVRLGTDVRRTALYVTAAGGVVNAQSGRHGEAASTLAARWAFDRLPVMAEVQLGGDLVPGLDAARGWIGGAAGVRLPLLPIAPVGFGELGFGKAYQASQTSSAPGAYLGVGLGAELALGRMVLFADIRRRWFHMDDWTASEDGITSEITYPDTTWISTTFSLGIGGQL